MKAKTFRFFPLHLVLLLVPAFHGVKGEADASGHLLYVSPNGSDQAGNGSVATPFATIANALKQVTSNQPATIRLLPGVYREQVTVPPAEGEKSTPVWTIEGEENGEVVFDGGEAITEWIALPPPSTGVFRVPNATGQTLRSGEEQYFEVWDPIQRIRFRKQADRAGVAAYPASVTVDNENDLLIHTFDGKEPNQLWRGSQAFAISIKRDAVVLRNITFRNYVGGGSAHAVAIDRGVRDVVVKHCRFENIVCAIQNDGAHTRVANVNMKEVSRGVETRGDEVVVEDCLIEAATGRFTFSDNNQHRRNGIRIYYPSRGGTIRRNVTAGFWNDLYIKTASTESDALPILVEHNTFIGGMNFGPKKQPKTVFRGNIIGPVDPTSGIRRLMGIGARFEDNYFFSPEYHEVSQVGQATNFVGPVPFANLIDGDLTPTEPLIVEHKMGAPLLHHQWIPAVRRQLERETTHKAAVGPLQILSPLEAVASRQGALLLATLNAPATEVVVKVRREGEKSWTQIPGRINRSEQPAVLGTPAPVEPLDPSGDTPYLFDLTGGRLAPGKTYEAVLVVRQENGANLESRPLTWQTDGNAKTIYVNPKAVTAEADGSSAHPWPRLQQALDRALPGDTVELAEGVHTHPAVLLHGGTEEHPILIRGQSKDVSIFDGGKEASVLLKLENAPHVVISDLTFRWFGDNGLVVSDSPSVRVERCHFQNSLARRGANGSAGLHVIRSPQAWISFNTFTMAENGAKLRDSPAFTFQNNTAFGNLYAGIQIVDSSRDSVLTHNAFTFTGNASVDILEKDRSAWDSITCNFNNYGNRLNNGPAPERPENDFRPRPHYGKVSGKAILRSWIALSDGAGEGSGKSFYSMKAWRDFSGKDSHSIFADPDYVDPLNNNFHVQAGSPHLLANGGLIGAEGLILPPSSAATP